MENLSRHPGFGIRHELNGLEFKNNNNNCSMLIYWGMRSNHDTSLDLLIVKNLRQVM